MFWDVLCSPGDEYSVCDLNCVLRPQEYLTLSNCMHEIGRDCQRTVILFSRYVHTV